MGEADQMTITEALDYIHATDWRGSIPGLSRVRELCERLGNPQERLTCIHVAGTNGKGSFCAMTASILREAGYRVGLYTSPYIYQFNERMRIDGVPISDEALAALVEEVRPHAEAMADPPTEFELITALAFLWFARSGVELVVLEVGLGGRLDATNLIPPPLLTVVTGIDLDHTAVLGDTPEAIAAEKAGIFKPGTPAVAGEVSAAVRAVLQERAAAVGAPFYAVELSSLKVAEPTREGIRFSFGDRRELLIPFLARYQARNAALVLTAVTLLRERGLTLSEEAIRQGLSKTEWRGRFEYLSREPDVIFDGSHNPQGIAAAAESIRALYSGRVLLLSGLMRDKDYRAMTETLRPLVERVYTVTPENLRSLPADELCAVWQEAGVAAEAYGDVTEALATAMAEAARSHRPLFILGSLYLYRQIRDAFDEIRG